MYLQCQQMDTYRFVAWFDTECIILQMTETWMDRAKSQMQMLGTAQEELAVKLGCTRGAVGHYLAGRRTPTLSQLDKIAKCLDVKTAWLLYGISETEIGEKHLDYSSYGHFIPITGTTETGARKKILGHIKAARPTPESYALLAIGTRWSPRIYEGEAVLIDPELNPDPGDEVLIMHSGEIRLCNLIKKTDKQITVSNIGGDNKRYLLAQKGIQYIHVIVAIFRMNKVIIIAARK